MSEFKESMVKHVKAGQGICTVAREPKLLEKDASAISPHLSSQTLIPS